MVQKFPNLLVLEEAGTEAVSPVLRAYGLVCVQLAALSFAASRKKIYIAHNFYQVEMLSYVAQKFILLNNILSSLLRLFCLIKS